MTNSNVSQKGLRPEKLWVPSLLLIAQFLTITPALLIVVAEEQQRKASDDVTFQEGLDRLSFAIAELENLPPVAGTRDGAEASAAWQQRYADYRGELESILSSSSLSPQIQEGLGRVDSVVKRMAKTESDLAVSEGSEQAAALAAGFGKDGRTARSELLNAQRMVRLQRSTAAKGIGQKTTYLKVLVSGACLLAFGVVFVIRKLRIDAAIQRKLQQELRTTNEEVVAALAAARSESETKNQYLAHVGNLMRTPLKGIAGRTAELLQTDLTSRQRDCAQSSRELAEATARMADQVVDYSRMESGMFELQRVEFHPESIVTNVLQLFSLPAERKGLTIKTAIGRNLPSVKGDPERLRQVLSNLTSNAVRFTQRGEVLLRVEELAGVEGRESLRFEVRDTGIGITEQVRGHIFQPFSQLRGSIPADDGAGLGLAISKKLVESMGGKMDVASEQGHGSTFSFTAVFESVRASAEPHYESSEAPSSDTRTVGANGNGARSLGSRKPPTERKDGRERRAAPRYRINHPTLLKSQDAGIAVIRVLDVSSSGLRVSAPFRLELQTEVEIRIEDISVVGIVRNCTCIRAEEFHIGIEIPKAVSENENSVQHLRLLRKVRVLNHK
jgi:signal transduction histidine kinase